MIVKKVNKNVRCGMDKVIKYQILTHCFFNDIKVSVAELKLLTELSKNNGIEINDLCEKLKGKCVYRTKQSARNAISKVEKKDLILKDGDTRKKRVYISDDINVQAEGMVFLEIKILGG
tara:strand:- start:65994 stop:66350 length:357 start_codon:yes stop_codon:yes gene_type:complete